MGGQVLPWGIVVAFVVMSAIAAVFVRRRRASRVLGRDEQLRQAKRATEQLAKASKKTRRGSMRGGGTAADSSNTSAAAYWGGGTGIDTP